VSVRPYRGSFEPVGVAHPVASQIESLAAQARTVRSRGHRVKHDSRMLDRPGDRSAELRIAQAYRRRLPATYWATILLDARGRHPDSVAGC
jgi:hypothetical protein